MMEFLDMN